MNLAKSTIGLFGTCGASTWRQSFVEYCKNNDISFYNPQLGEGEWNPDFANDYVRAEHFHLANDDIVVFAITNETIASVSLSEFAFSIMDAARSSLNRHVVMFIAEDCIDPKASQDAITASIKARKTVIPKMVKAAKESDFIHLCTDMEKLFSLTFEIESMLRIQKSVNKHKLSLVA